MLNPGVLLFLCVVVAGCSGSLRELKAQLRAKRARALGLQVDDCGEQGGGQCGYSYPEDQENPRDWAQYQQVSLQQHGMQDQGYPGQDVSGQRFPGHPGMETGQGFPGQNVQFQGQHPNFPGINPIVQSPGQQPNSQNYPGHGPATPNFPGPPGTCMGPEGLPPGANAPYCFTEDGQPRLPGMPPGTPLGMPSPQSEFAQRWRSPLLTQPTEQLQQSSMAPVTPNPYQFSEPRDQTFQQYSELPGSKLRKKLDALLHPPKQSSSKYSPHFSSNYHHPQTHRSPKMKVLPPPKMYPELGDVMQRTAESESKALPSEWAQQPYGRNQPNYQRPSTTTTPKPLSSFFRDFMPKYVETVPPPTCPISPAYQESEQQQQQQQAAMNYEQPESRQPAPYEQHTDHQTSQHSIPSRHQFDRTNVAPYDHRSHFMPKSFQPN